MSNKTAVLVTGATGKQGGAAINALLDSPQAAEMEIRFLTRNPSSSSASKLTKRGAKAYKADLLDAASLDQALQGVHLAFLVTDNMGGVDKEEQMGKTLVDEAKKQGVKHLVFTSVCAADTATQVPHFNSKYQVSCLYPAHLVRMLKQCSGRLKSTLSHLAYRTLFFVLSLLW